MTTDNPSPVTVIQGDSPLVLAVPHSATWLPPDILARLNTRGKLLTDTDWHVDRLYGDLLPGATMVLGNFHRYVIDANRPPNDANLYPGQNTTGLVPQTDFDGSPIWVDPPGSDEIAHRHESYHAPYHRALSAELERVQGRHGVAILYDCHSIRSRIPNLFDGTLSDFNIGTADGTTCSPTIQTAIHGICAATPGYSTVLNGRFRGGWTTRHYGRPDTGWHAIQMELAQSSYLAHESPPFEYDTVKVDRLRRVLTDILEKLVALAPRLSV